MTETTEEFPVNTLNEFAVQAGQNLANHSASLAGYSKFIKLGTPVVLCRTKQEAYRLSAYLRTMADAHGLPDEPGEHTYDQVEAAIQSS